MLRFINTDVIKGFLLIIFVNFSKDPLPNNLFFWKVSNGTTVLSITFHAGKLFTRATASSIWFSGVDVLTFCGPHFTYGWIMKHPWDVCMFRYLVATVL